MLDCAAGVLGLFIMFTLVDAGIEGVGGTSGRCHLVAVMLGPVAPGGGLPGLRDGLGHVPVTAVS